MPKINRTYCAVYGCLSNNIKHPGHSFFSIPTKPQALSRRWLRAISRLDLMNNSRYRRVCEEHFKPEDILIKSTRRLLKKNVVPSLNLPWVDHDAVPEDEIENEEVEETEQVIEDSFSESEEDNITTLLENRQRKEEEVFTGFSEKIKVEIDDPEDHDAVPEDELENEVEETKQEIDDSFSEYEEDITTVLENRKRKEEEVFTGFSKKIKAEIQEDPEVAYVENKPHPDFGRTSRKHKETVNLIKRQTTLKKVVIPINPLPKPKQVLTVEVNRDNEIFPIDFMKSVLSSQEEILTVLKSQVLLENPDPDLLTFLRLLGAKLSRLNREDRIQLQNAIINLIK